MLHKHTYLDVLTKHDATYTASSISSKMRYQRVTDYQNVFAVLS